MKPLSKSPYSAVEMERDRRNNRLSKTVSQAVTFTYKGKIYRGQFTRVGKLLVVSCGKVTTNVVARPGHPEPQARHALFELATAGKLRQFAALD